MRNLEFKLVQKKKKNSYNVYGIKDSTFCILSSVMCALIVVSVLQLVIDPLPLPVCILADTGILLGALTFAFLKNHFEKVWIESYQRHNGFEFIGLYDLSGSKSLEGKGYFIQR